MWQIESYQLDPATFSLCRAGAPIELQRRPLDLLVYLIARHGQVVPRDELFCEVWGGVVVSDGALSTAVYEVRVALGDHARDRSECWVETVRGRGIRFRGPVREIGPTPTSDRFPFVGRDAIASELYSDAKNAADGHGGIHLIEGPAGIGKTRLIQEVMARLPELAQFTAFGEPAGPPFWPWIQLANALVPKRAQIGEWLECLGDDEAGGEATGQHFARVEQIGSILANAASHRPIVLVIEDLHWIDGASIELLNSLAPRIATLPIQVFATLRSEDQASAFLGKVRDAPSVKRDRLEPLSVIDLYALIEAVLGDAPSPELVDWMRENSAGIPLVARELAEQISTFGENLTDVPELARRLFSRRFDEVDQETRTILGVAALCGERFDISLVEAAVEDFLTRGRSWIQEGLGVGILVPNARNPLRFAFRHALLRDAARGQLASGEAAKWHGRLATVIERQHPDLRDDALFRLARHTAEAAIENDEVERPLRYALLAAGRAIESFAWEEVRLHSEHVLDWIEFIAPGPERDAQEIEAALLHAAAIATSSGHVEETDLLLARIEPLLSFGAEDRATGLVAGFRFAKARNLGDYKAARAFADVVSEQKGLEQVARCWRTSLAALSGSFADATSDSEWRTSLLRKNHFADYAKRCGRDPGIDRLVFSSLANWAIGRDEDAVADAHRAIHWAESVGDARGKVIAIFHLCLLHDLRRDWKSLRVAAFELDPFAERHRIVNWLGSGTGFGLWGRARQEGIRDHPGASILRDRGRGSSTCIGSALLLLGSRIHSWNGELAAAEAVAQEALEVCLHRDERFMQAEIQRGLGEIRKTMGDESGAREHWRQALVVAREQGHVVSEIRTLASRHDAGDRDRLNDLRSTLEPGLGPWETELLARALA